jgi:hypothetical protein
VRIVPLPLQEGQFFRFTVPNIKLRYDKSVAPNMYIEVVNKQIELLGKDGKPVWYVTIHKNHLILEFEYSPVGDLPGMESIIRINDTSYNEIKSNFDLNPKLSILDTLTAISEVGKGQDFKSWVYDGGIPYNTEFVWFSFDD